MDLMSITLVVRWLIGWGLMWGLPRLPDLSVVGSPKVSVLIPARNEESTLPHLLTALEQQTFKPYEIIVIDDQSVDATAQIAKQAGVNVVQTAPLPTGWTGKNWASKPDILTHPATFSSFSMLTLSQGKICSVGWWQLFNT